MQGKNDIIYNYFNLLNGFYFLRDHHELIYFIYNLSDEPDIELEIRIVKKLLTDMTYVPKELLFWVKRIIKSDSFKKAKPDLQNLIRNILSDLNNVYHSQKENLLFSVEKKIVDIPKSQHKG